MPYTAQALGVERPWRAGATLREIELGDRLIRWMQDGDTALRDMQRLAQELAAFPEAELRAALRTESGFSLLLEVDQGRVRERELELVDPLTHLAVDPDSDAVVLPEVATKISAELIASVLVRRFGPCVEVVNDAHLVVSPAQRSLLEARTALGIVAQLAEVEVSALIENDANGRQYLAELDPARGCRIRPLELVHEDPGCVERFARLAGMGPAEALDWERPELPSELARAGTGTFLVQVVGAPLSSGTSEDRLAALADLVSRKPEGWVAEVLAAAESMENRSERFAEVRKELYRVLSRVPDPRAAALLWQRLRDEDDELSRTISHSIWQQPVLLDRIPRAVLDHWDDDREFAVRLVVAAIDAHLLWPTELQERTPESVLTWLRKEGLVQMPAAEP